MKLKATDEKAQDVAMVLVDSKLVPRPVELDTEEGWVIALVPKVDSLIYLDKAIVEENDPYVDAEKEGACFEWAEVRLTGKVEIIWRRQESN